MVKPSFLIRELAAKHEIAVETLCKAIEGKAIRGAAAQKRANSAVAEYQQRMAPTSPATTTPTRKP